MRAVDELLRRFAKFGETPAFISEGQTTSYRVLVISFRRNKKSSSSRVLAKRPSNNQVRVWC